MSEQSDLEQDRQIARQLRRTWPAFFERFGRLRAVQRAAIPVVLSGHDALIVAPTASGKTEAACAPLVERYATPGARRIILYVSPTRALVNDLHVRLREPLARLGLHVVRRTGDHHEPLTGPPSVVLTTPESFDSLLCRQRLRPIGHALADVVAVVLDEIHLLHGSPRGEQVRWLLERLRRLRRQAVEERWVSSSHVQVVALSATVPDIDDVKQAYLGDSCNVPPIGGGRELRVIPEELAAQPTEVALLAYLDAVPLAERPRKLLVFANQRLRVDQLTAMLREPLEARGFEVRAHHGSLARPEREAAEAAARSDRKLVLFATSTLEIGIDIGDIDLVVLDGPALSVPALLQRVGRGNRRASETVLLPCGGPRLERLVHDAMIAAARAGDLGPAERGPQHAVARQQVVSYIFQSRERSRSRQQVQGLLDGCGAPVVARDVLGQMVAAGELVEDSSGLRLGAEWLDRSTRGEIHANIEGALGDSVVDEVTGAHIALDVREHAGPGIGVGGLKLEVRRRAERRIEVRSTEVLERTRGTWRYATRPFMRGAGQPQAVRRFLGLGPDDWPVLQAGDMTYVFHFGGARRQAVLELLLSQLPSPPAVELDEWRIALDRYDGTKPEWITGGTPALLQMAIDGRLEALERLLARPFANKRLPRSVRVDEVRGWLAIESELTAFQMARWLSEHDERVRQALELLA